MRVGGGEKGEGSRKGQGCRVSSAEMETLCTGAICVNRRGTDDSCDRHVGNDGNRLPFSFLLFLCFLLPLYDVVVDPTAG